MVLDWTVVGDSCDSESSECTGVNIYFDTNLLHSDASTNGASGNNRPVDPIFVWNVTAYDDFLSNIPTFQTELAVFPPYDWTKHSVRHTRSSQVYYPFDRYLAEIFGFAEDASTNDTVSLSLNSASGLAVGLKISTEVDGSSSQDGDPEVIDVVVTLQRGTLVIWYCLVITITFWFITLMICLVMIMTVGFGFQQRNEIVTDLVIYWVLNVRYSVGSQLTPDTDFVGVLPCLVLLSISAVTMVGIYVFTDPSKDSREKLTWHALVNALRRPRDVPIETFDMKNTAQESYRMVPLSRD
ncbi:uncharacterized protein EV420DRAFT_1638857 [Desarmillaria tabescens]|uniref:Uncharacterized protein n=1 Tax=Armillaria tabescens TaxID=1929756 RepID=A0AA39NE34_ARMTA|nr:uncharacterized protein EV420DRAFT_1638857 [Desarmillaria tabescens]KAK0463937.1 hypothetical protein EV420DRAFT_1638857 [Desarmillaria tabescens]